MTQVQTVYKHLLKFGKINSLEAIQRYGITRISSVIYDLRQSGIAIDSTFDDPLNPQFATYRINFQRTKQHKMSLLVEKLKGRLASVDSMAPATVAKLLTDATLEANRIINTYN